MKGEGKMLSPDTLHNSSHTRSIFPASVPLEVKKLLAAAPNMERSVFRKMIKVALAHLQQSQDERECEAAFDTICRALECHTEQQAMAVAEQYSGVVSLVRAVLRLNARTIRQQHLHADLLALGLQEHQSGDVCKVVFGGARTVINDQLTAAAPSLPSARLDHWNMTVIPANSSTPHVLEPAIAMTFEFDSNSSSNQDRDSATEHDGNPNTITGDVSSHRRSVSLSVDQFHQLRYTVANLLHQMDALETLPGGPRHSATPAATPSAV